MSSWYTLPLLALVSPLFLRGMLCSNGCIQPSCSSYKMVAISNHNCRAFIIQLQKLSCGWAVGKKVSEESKILSILIPKPFYLWFSQFCLDVKNFMLLPKSERICSCISYRLFSGHWLCSFEQPYVYKVFCKRPRCLQNLEILETAFQTSFVNNLGLCE